MVTDILADLPSIRGKSAGLRRTKNVAYLLLSEITNTTAVWPKFVVFLPLFSVVLRMTKQLRQIIDF